MAYLASTTVDGPLYVNGNVNISNSSYNLRLGSHTTLTGSYNTALGYNTVTNGYGVAIGYNSKANYSGSIAIGYNASGPTTAASTHIGYSYTSTGRALALGVNGTGYTFMNAAGSTWTTASDKRDKINIETIESALDFIMKLRPVTYNMNLRTNYLETDENGKKTFNESEYKKGTKKNNRRFAGLVAQEAYQAMKDYYQDDNYADLVDWSAYDNPELEDTIEDQYSVLYTSYVPFLIRAIQEQQEQIESLKEEIEKLKIKE